MYFHNKNKFKSLAYFSLFSFAVLTAQAQTWQPLGPGPLLNGQSEGITNTPVIGAIEGIATHPTDDDIIYIASVNGGIWKTTNGTDASPSWTPLTDNQASLSMSDIEFDIADATHQTLVAAFGRRSSLLRLGGSREGLIRTTNGGASWTQLAGMSGRSVRSVLVNGANILAGVDIADSFTCSNIGIFKSPDTGVNWNQTLSLGAVNALILDPHNISTMYAGVHTFDGACSPGAISGIYKSSDSGDTWAKVSNAAMEALIGTDNCHYEISVGPNSDTVFAGFACQGVLAGVFQSTDESATWTAMDIPTTSELDLSTPGDLTDRVDVGIHPGGQGGTHFSLVADPTNANLVYVGGDRQTTPLGSDNSIGATNFTGRLFRGDASQSSGSQWSPLTHSGTSSNSAPHADSRELRFDSSNSLLEADDGGIYRRQNHTANTGDWISVNGDLQVNEQHDTAYDKVADVTISGNQDNGSSGQSLFSSQTWSNYSSGDGGDVVVDVLSLSGSNESMSMSAFKT